MNPSPPSYPISALPYRRCLVNSPMDNLGYTSLELTYFSSPNLSFLFPSELYYNNNLITAIIQR